MRVLQFVLAAMILAITTSASAYDLTYIGRIKAKETKSVKIYLPEGKSQVDVWDGGKITCQYNSSGIYGPTIEQANVSKCSITIVSPHDSDMWISLSNLEEKDNDFNIQVH